MPASRPMAATTCSRTPAAVRAWDARGRAQLCPPNCQSPRADDWEFAVVPQTRPTVAIMTALVQTPPDSEGNRGTHWESEAWQRGQRRDLAGGPRREKGMRGSAEATRYPPSLPLTPPSLQVRCARFPCESCFEHGKRRVDSASHRINRKRPRTRPQQFQSPAVATRLR